MAAKNYFSKEEIILCTYSALYNAEDFGGIERIEKIKKRSISSIKMKIQNIVAMLDEEGIKRYNNMNSLSGLPEGQKGRRTNWEIVKILVQISEIELLGICQKIAKI